MTSSWKSIRLLCSVMALNILFFGCSPIESPPPLYTSAFFKQSIHFYEEDDTQILGLKDTELRLLLNSSACDYFTTNILNHIYTLLFKQSPPPPVEWVRKKIKDYARKHFSGKVNQGDIRNFSNHFATVYREFAEFFADKSQTAVLEEWSFIERSLDGDSPEDLPQNVSVFLNQLYRTLGRLEEFIKSLGLRCVAQDSTAIHRITFPVGVNLFEMAEMLSSRHFISKEEFLRECHNKKFIKEVLGENADNVEGYLYPGSYSLMDGENASDLLRKMMENFLNVYSSLETDTSLSRHQVVTLASMIEEEAVVDEEKPVIASVFYNRLKTGMRMQSDPTVSYGVWKTEGKKSKITRKHILRTTPYNTYRRGGLPYGPISNPGFHSLRAVFHPRKTPYFYFVSKNGRTHVFSKNYSDHKKAVAAYRRYIRSSSAFMPPVFLYSEHTQ